MMEDTKTESQDNILPTLDWMLEAGGSSQAEGDPQAQVQGYGGRVRYSSAQPSLSPRL